MTKRIDRTGLAAAKLPPAPGDAAAKASLATSGRSGSKVVVGCKLPRGLTMRIFKWAEQSVPVLGGGYRTEKISRVLPGVVTIFGNAKGFGEDAPCQVYNGFALTPNVDRDFFATWMEQNEDSDVVANGLVFAEKDLESAIARSAEGAKVRSNLEPLHMGGKKPDPRVAAIGKRITTADEQKTKVVEEEAA